MSRARSFKDDKGTRYFDFSSVFAAGESKLKKSEFFQKFCYNANDFSSIPHNYLKQVGEVSYARELAATGLLASFEDNDEIKRIVAGEFRIDGDEILAADAQILVDIVLSKLKELVAVDPNWEVKLKNHIANFYKDNNLKYDSLYYCKKIIKTVGLISHDKEGNLLSESDRATEFEKFKSVINFECLGGGIGAVDQYYERVSSPGAFWPEVKSKMAVALLNYCPEGNESHLLTWLDYIMFADRGRDGMFFTSSRELTRAQINEVLQKITFGLSDSLIDFFSLTQRCYDLILYANSIKQIDAENIELSEEEKANLTQEHLEDLINKKEGLIDDRFALIINNLKISHQEISRSQDEEAVAYGKRKTADEILSVLNIDFADILSNIGGQSFEDLSFIRGLIKEKMALSWQSESSLLKNDANYRHFVFNLANALNLVKTFAAKNELSAASPGFVPLWLQKELKNFARQAVVSGYIKENILHLIAASTNKLETLVSCLSKELWLASGCEIKFERGSISTLFAEKRSLTLQEILHAGGSCQAVFEVMERYLAGGIDVIDVSGLLFHPEQAKIIALLRSKNFKIDYKKMLSKAIIQGDTKFILENFETIQEEFLQLLNDREFCAQLLPQKMEDLYLEISSDPKLQNPRAARKELVGEKGVAIAIKFMEVIAEKWLDQRSYDKMMRHCGNAADLGSADAQISLAYFAKNFAGTEKVLDSGEVLDSEKVLDSDLDMAIRHYVSYYNNPNKKLPHVIYSKLLSNIPERFVKDELLLEKWLAQAKEQWNDLAPVGHNIALALIEYVISNKLFRFLNSSEAASDFQDLVMKATRRHQIWPDVITPKSLLAEYYHSTKREQEAFEIYYELATGNPVHMPSVGRLFQFYTQDRGVAGWQAHVMTTEQRDLLIEKASDYLVQNPNVSFEQKFSFIGHVAGSSDIPSDEVARNKLLPLMGQVINNAPPSEIVQAYLDDAELSHKCRFYKRAIDLCLCVIYPEGDAEAQVAELRPNLAILTPQEQDASKVKACLKLAELFFDQKACDNFPDFMKTQEFSSSIIKFCENKAKEASLLSAKANAILGCLFYDGISQGIGLPKAFYVKQDRQAAKLYLERAGSDPQAMNCLASEYYYGGFYEKDRSKAFRLYKSAAEQGCAEAQYNLGYCYKFKKGTPEDLSDEESDNLADKWFKRACANDAPSHSKASSFLSAQAVPGGNFAAKSAAQVGERVIGAVRQARSSLGWGP